MAGTVIKNLIILAGGQSSSQNAATRKCYALDLENSDDGWFEMPEIPGDGRIHPVCARFRDEFYFFSGILTPSFTGEQKAGSLLRDGYRLSVTGSRGKWSGSWKILAPMPRGVAAAGNPLPVFGNGKMLFWGGVDDKAVLHNDPSSHPGFSKNLLFYDAQLDAWSDVRQNWEIEARATLPAIYWNDCWIFISGEIRPGMRTNCVTGIDAVKYSLS